MAGVSGTARGCPGGLSSPLATSQNFGVKHRAVLRTGRQRAICVRSAFRSLHDRGG